VSLQEYLTTTYDSDWEYIDGEVLERRVPDIAVTISRPAGRVLREPPFLCIEILSPEDRASRGEEKIDDYLQFGVPFRLVT
jgi:Uma2 family endonuclease